MLGSNSFDYIVRSVTAALLSLGILGVSAWQLISTGQLSEPLSAWAGMVVGVYFGSHVSINGSESRRRTLAPSHAHDPPESGRKSA